MGNIFLRPVPLEDPPAHLKHLSDDQLNELRGLFRDPQEDGVCATPTDDDDGDGNPYTYLKLRDTVWNLDSVGWPCCIVQPTTVEKVSELVRFAKRHGLLVCVKTVGGHSGHALVDNCVAIDLSNFRHVTVDAKAKTVSIGGGAMIGDVDSACAPHLLALVMGQVHHTGVAGMALNATSGIGYLTRTRGLCVQHLKAVNLVLSNGDVLENVTAASHPDLFWGMQGAGSNFGIATNMTFGLTAVPRFVLCGDIVKFPVGEGPPIWNSGKTRLELLLNHINYFVAPEGAATPTGTAPDELSVIIVLAGRGPVVARVAYIPQEQDVHNNNKDKEDENMLKALAAVRPLRSFGTSLQDYVQPQNYFHGLQKTEAMPRSYFYQKAAYCAGIPNDAFGKLCELVKMAPAKPAMCAILIQPLGGKSLRRLKTDEIPTAQTFAASDYWFILVTRFPRGKADGAMRDKCVAWVRECYNVLEPFAVNVKKANAGDASVNADATYWNESQGSTIGAGSAQERLVQLKNKYDPDNFFRHNRNIEPTVMSS